MADYCPQCGTPTDTGLNCPRGCGKPMTTNLTDLLRRMAAATFSEDRLSGYRWYREQRGGFWCHSRRLGWQQRNDVTAQHDIECCKHLPELYDNGRDIEDYRAQALNAATVRAAAAGKGGR